MFKSLHNGDPDVMGLSSHLVTLCAIRPTLLDGGNVRLNWNIESDINVNWIKFKNFLSLY